MEIVFQTPRPNPKKTNKQTNKQTRKSTPRGSESFICCQLAGMRKFNLALYQEMTSLGI